MRLIASFLLAGACICAQNTRVILLGTGTPNPDPDRMGPAVAVVSGNKAYIVDSGPGVVRRAAQARIGMDQITRLFLTHLHSDHTAGLPDLIFTPAVTGRKEPLEIFGPPGTRQMITHILEAWRQDIDIRLHGLEHGEPKAYEVKTTEIKPGKIYGDDLMKVVAFPVKHGSWEHAYGYRFEAKDKIIVISGDATYSEGLIEAAKGSDILVHEVYSQKGWERRTPNWQKYHAAFHTSAPDLGRIAATVKPKKLVLYHQLLMGETPDEILAEVRTHWSGAVIYANDLDVIR